MQLNYRIGVRRHRNYMFGACHSQGKIINCSKRLRGSHVFYCLRGWPALNSGLCDCLCLIQELLFPDKSAIISQELYLFLLSSPNVSRSHSWTIQVPEPVMSCIHPPSVHPSFCLSFQPASNTYCTSTMWFLHSLSRCLLSASWDVAFAKCWRNNGEIGPHLMGLLFKQESDTDKTGICMNIHISVIMTHLINAVRERPWSHDSL